MALPYTAKAAPALCGERPSENVGSGGRNNHLDGIIAISLQEQQSGPGHEVYRARKIEPRPYQTDIKAKYNSCVAYCIRKIIIVAPTGSGKTVIALSLIHI